MKLIVGLGNPDKEYQNTFHNLGFMCVDKLAEIIGIGFDKAKCRALIAETKIKDENTICVDFVDQSVITGKWKIFFLKMKSKNRSLSAPNRNLELKLQLPCTKLWLEIGNYLWLNAI